MPAFVCASSAPPAAVGEFACMTEPVVEAAEVVQKAKKENKKAEVPLGEGTVGAGGEAKKEMPVEEEAPQAQEPDGTPVGPHVEDTSPEHRHSPTKTKEEEAVAGQEAPVPMGQAEAAPAGRETPAGKTKVDREEAVMEPVREEPLVPAKQDTIAAESQGAAKEAPAVVEEPPKEKSTRDEEPIPASDEVKASAVSPAAAHKTEARQSTPHPPPSPSPHPLRPSPQCPSRRQVLPGPRWTRVWRETVRMRARLRRSRRTRISRRGCTGATLSAGPAPAMS
mmetsp:Transcript_51933/g.130475  ORF Transcript_51933/g.130475 Transcript_51933/m.130475 type:complete len:280 (-) Transcript_51933:723-1562(-)